MRQKLALIAVLAAILTLGLIFASCDNPLGDGNGDITGGGDENTILLAMGNGGVVYKFTVSQAPANVAVGDDIAGAMLSLSGSTKSFSGTIAEKESMIDSWKIKISLSSGGDTEGQLFYLTLDNEGNLMQIEGDIPEIDDFTAEALGGSLDAIGENGTGLEGVWCETTPGSEQTAIFNGNVAKARNIGRVNIEVGSGGEILAEGGSNMTTATYGGQIVQKDKIMEMIFELADGDIFRITHYSEWRYMENAFVLEDDGTGDDKISVHEDTLTFLGGLPSDWETNGITEDSVSLSPQDIKDKTVAELLGLGLQFGEGSQTWDRYTINLP